MKKKKKRNKIKAKFAAFGIRLDAEPMMKTTLAFFSNGERHTMHPGLDADIPESDVTYSSFEEMSKIECGQALLARREKKENKERTTQTLVTCLRRGDRQRERETFV